MYATLDASADAVAAARSLSDRQHPGVSVSAEIAALRVLTDQVCAEAGVWAPDAATRAIAQTAGDVARAVTLVRVWAATLPEAHVDAFSGDDLLVTRRVSAAYHDVPAGQWLGSSDDFGSRLLAWEPTVMEPSPPPEDVDGRDTADRVAPPSSGTAAATPRRSMVPRVASLLTDVPVVAPPAPVDGVDPTRAPLTFPAERPALLAALARAETGALVALSALALAHRREAVLTEASVLSAAVHMAHPRTGRRCRVARVPLCDAEIVLDAESDGQAALRVGYGASLGRLERRALSAALLDGVLGEDAAGHPTDVTLDAPTVAHGLDGQATSGFIDHLRLPHYASFASYLDLLNHGEDGP